MEWMEIGHLETGTVGDAQLETIFRRPLGDAQLETPEGSSYELIMTRQKNLPVISKIKFLLIEEMPCLLIRE
jgi:hypothetical protein